MPRERAARHAVKYGFTADTYRDVYIASRPRKYAPLSRRCRQPTGHRAPKDASDRLHADDLFNYWSANVDLSRS